LTVYVPSATQYTNIPFEITVVATYPPNDTLALNPVGNFLFSPTSATLSPTQNSVSFNVTPLAPGDGSLKVLLSGASAPLYQLTSWQAVTVNKCMSLSQHKSVY
jgi:hypothetical protein